MASIGLYLAHGRVPDWEEIGMELETLWPELTVTQRCVMHGIIIGLRRKLTDEGLPYAAEHMPCENCGRTGCKCYG